MTHMKRIIRVFLIFLLISTTLFHPNIAEAWRIPQPWPIWRLDIIYGEIPEYIMKYLFNEIKMRILTAVKGTKFSDSLLNALENAGNNFLGKAKAMIAPTSPIKNLSIKEIEDKRDEIIQKAMSKLRSTTDQSRLITAYGGGLPVGHSATSTAITKLLAEDKSKPDYKQFADLGMPIGHLPDVTSNTFIELVRIDTNITSYGNAAFINIGLEQKIDMTEKILKEIAVVGVLKENMVKVENQMPGEITNMNWGAQISDGAVAKAWYDALKSHIVTQNKNTMQMILMQRLLQRKDMLLAIYINGKIPDYGNIVRQNIKRYTRVYDIEFQRITR